MPKSIVRFERMAFSALALGLVSLALNWPIVLAAYNRSPIVYLLTLAITFGGQLLLIWLIARKRRNWARWVWIGITFVGTAIGIIVIGSVPFAGPSAAGAYILVYLVSFISACLLLTPTSRAWFQAKSDGPNIQQ